MALLPTLQKMERNRPPGFQADERLVRLYMSTYDVVVVHGRVLLSVSVDSCSQSISFQTLPCKRMFAELSLAAEKPGDDLSRCFTRWCETFDKPGLLICRPVGYGGTDIVCHGSSYPVTVRYFSAGSGKVRHFCRVRFVLRTMRAKFNHFDIV